MICADQYRAVCQAVADAIDSSIMRNEIACVEASGYRYDAVADALALEAEGCDDDGEFWGIDLNGNEWRVRVVQS